jgi:hypothetical protein
MLQTYLATPLSNTKQQEAKYWLGELLYLPLAVAQAAACMNASGMTVQNYQAQLDEHEEAAIEHTSDSSAGKLRSSSIAESALDVHRLIHQALRKRLQAQGQFQQPIPRNCACEVSHLREVVVAATAEGRDPAEPR